MITKKVKVTKWPRENCVDGYEYVVIAANGAGIATMCQKGLKGLANAILIKDAVNAALLLREIEQEAAKL